MTKEIEKGWIKIIRIWDMYSNRMLKLLLIIFLYSLKVFVGDSQEYKYTFG